MSDDYDSTADTLKHALRVGELMAQPCDVEHTAPDGTEMVCNVLVNRPGGPRCPHADGRFEPYFWEG